MREWITIVGMLLVLETVHVSAVELSHVIEDPLCAIHIQDGNLSLKVKNIELGQLIDDVGYKAGFTIISYAELNQRVSFKFNNVPLGIALKRLLRNRSHMIQFDDKLTSGTNSSAMVKALWILPQQGDAQPFSNRRTVSGLVPFKSRDFQSNTTINSDITEREDTIADMGMLNDSYTLGELSLALGDEDSSIREAAIQSLGERGDVSAVNTLAIALADIDPEIREEAVYALGDIGGDAAIKLLQQALGDSVDFVREAAMDTLEEIQSEDE